MDACIAKAVRRSQEQLAVVSQVSTIDRCHKVRHHFIAPRDVVDPPELPDGGYDLRNPVEIYEYCRILVENLDPARFEVETIGWHFGLEAIEEAVLSNAWVESTAKDMCALAALSGTTYGGWDWMSRPAGRQGMGLTNDS